MVKEIVHLVNQGNTNQNQDKVNVCHVYLDNTRNCLAKLNVQVVMLVISRINLDKQTVNSVLTGHSRMQQANHNVSYVPEVITKTKWEKQHAKFVSLENIKLEMIHGETE